MKKLGVFLIILGSLLAWNYKNKIRSFFDKDQTHILSETSGSNLKSDLFENDGFIEKFNVYIDFQNSFNKRVDLSYNQYFKWADRENGPSEKSKNVSGVITLYNYSLTYLEEALKKEPKIEEVDDLIKIVLKDATTLNGVLEKASSYYDRQDYKDDNFTKAQEFHKEIVLAYDNYLDSYGKMYVVFKRLQDRFREFELNKFKDTGQMLRYNLLTTLNKAFQVFELIGNLEGDQLLNLDLEKLKTTLAEYREAHDILESLSTDESVIEQEFGENFSSKSYLLSFIKDGNVFIKECRSLQERIEEKHFSYSIVHPSIPDNGTPEKLREVYTDMITNYNRIN